MKTTYSKTMLTVAALSLCAGTLAGCAATNPGAEAASQTASRAPDACFQNGDITNVNIVNDRTLYVSTRRGYVYRLDAPSGCYIQGASISVAAFSGGPNLGICIGNQAKVAVGSSFRFPSAQCIADITGPYTDSRQSGLWSRTAAP